MKMTANKHTHTSANYIPKIHDFMRSAAQNNTNCVFNSDSMLS